MSSLTAKSETWDFNLADDEGLSVTFDKVKLASVDTVTLKDVNGKITAEIDRWRTLVVPGNGFRNVEIALTALALSYLRKTRLTSSLRAPKEYFRPGSLNQAMVGPFPRMIPFRPS